MIAGKISEGNASLTADDLRPRLVERHCWVWRARLGYDGSVVFSCQGSSVLKRADCDVTLGELENSGCFTPNISDDNRNPSETPDYNTDQ